MSTTTSSPASGTLPPIPAWKEAGRFTDILFHTCDEGIAKITINRPEVRNAFRPQTVIEMRQAFAEARENPGIGVIVLTGQGPLADLMTATHDITSTSGPDIKRALAGLSEALRTGADGGAATKQNLDAIITNLSTLTDGAARNETQIREFGSYIRQLTDLLASENIGQGATGRRLNNLLGRLNDILGTNGDNLRNSISSSARLSRALVDYRRELAEVFDVAPLAIDNAAGAIDMENGMLRVGAHFDNVFFDSSMTKEVCNILGLRQLGCRTGSIRDLGPDFGITSVLDGLTKLGDR